MFFVYITFREDIQIARETGDWKGVKEFYATTFDSFLEINAAFKVSSCVDQSISC